jgi:hypothetical protein
VVVAGVDVGNATTEVVVVADGRVLGVDRIPTRGRKGSPESLRAAATLVHRLERRLGIHIDEARIAPLRAVGTSILTIPHVAPPAGRLRVLAAGVGTPGGAGVCAGAPLWLDTPPSEGGAIGPPDQGPVSAGPVSVRSAASRWPALREPAPERQTSWSAAPVGTESAETARMVAVVRAGTGYGAAAQRVRELLAAGVPVGAVLVAGDEGVLIANRVPAGLPVIDQVDVTAVSGCELVAVEVRPPGQPLTLLADPVALAAAFSLRDDEAADAATVSRGLLDCSNAVVGCVAPGSAGPSRPLTPADRAGVSAGPGVAGGRAGADEARAENAGPPGPGEADHARGGSGAVPGGSGAFRDGSGARADGAGEPGRPGQPGEPWVLVGGGRVPLRIALADVAAWPVGAVQAIGDGTAETGETDVDDLFALDLGAVAETATARQDVLGKAALVASLHRLPDATDHAAMLAGLLERPVRSVLSEPAAARVGALTTPGARPDAVVVDLGAGTIDVITPAREVVAAGAGDLLTAAVAETLGLSRAAADWVKRGPCVRVDGGQRYEAEDGSRGFLDRPAPASAAGMLAVSGPAGLLPFDRGHSPAEWRALRLRLKQAVFAANLRRALTTLGDARLPQVLIVGGPAGDDELLGVLLRSFPAGVTAGRARVGGTLPGPSAGHRYAAALGLALSDAR